ncbi:MAG: non-canonical purine NTP pyrophosphatase [bacterium]
MQLLIATTNPAKAADYKNILAQFKIDSVTLGEMNVNDDVEETGKTLEENACLKASYYAKKISMPAISDDSGFEIDALNGEPGVYSRRWPGYEATDEELINMVVTNLANVSLPQRTAKFTNITALSDAKGNIITTSPGFITGFIPETICAKRWPHFPYRSCLFVPQFNKFWGELSDEEFKQLNFRYRAVEKIIPQIKKLIQ